MQETVRARAGKLVLHRVTVFIITSTPTECHNSNINLKRKCYIREHYSHFDNAHLQQKVIRESLVIEQLSL